MRFTSGILIAWLPPPHVCVQVAVPLPDVKGRAEILEYYLSDKPVVAGLDQALLARQTSGMSGADLSNLVGSILLVPFVR
jgi:ATP-dependent Zn protease